MLSILSVLIYIGFKIVIFLFINALILSIGIGIGTILNKLIPSISIEIGSLIGVISTVISFYCYQRIAEFFRFINDFAEDNELEIKDGEKGKLFVYPEGRLLNKKKRRNRKK